MADKDIKIDINVGSDTKGAKDAVKDIGAVGEASSDLSEKLSDVTEEASETVNQLQRIKDLNAEAGRLGGEGNYEAARELREEAALLYEEYVKIGEATAEAADATAEFNEETERTVEATEQLKEVIEEINEVKEDSVEINVEAKEALEQYVGQAEDAVEAFEDEAKAAQKMNKEIEKIRAIQQAQLLGEFARGLRDIARAAENNGMPELAEGLNKASTAFKTTATVIQGGLGISQLISQLGGLKASLAAVATFLTGPLGIALGVAAAAYLALEFAVKKASDEMDRFAAEAAKPITVFGDIEQRSKEAVKVVIDGINQEIKALDDLIDKRRVELDIIRQKANEQLAVVDAEAAVLQAQVDAEEASGDISGEEAIIKRAKIQEDSIRKRYAIELEERRKINAAEKQQADDAAAAYANQLASVKEIKEKFNEKPVNFTEEQLADLKRLGDEANKQAAIIKKFKGLRVLGVSTPEERAAEEEFNRIYDERVALIQSAASDTKIEYQDTIKVAEDLLETLGKTAEIEKKQSEDVQRRLLSEQTIAETRVTAELEVLKSTTAITVQKKLQAAVEKKAREDKKKEDAAAKKADKEDKKTETDRARAEGDLTTAAKKVEGIAEGLGAEGGIDPQGFQRLQLAVAKLEDGVTTGEATEIGVLVNSLSGYIIKQSEADLATKERIRQLNEKIKSLASQVKNNRPKN